jgi:hypothetical protein
LSPTIKCEENNFIGKIEVPPVIFGTIINTSIRADSD